MLTQIIIAITGVGAVWLSQDARASHRKYACLFGLAGQPFWFYSSFTTEQWGIFFLSFVYTLAWIKGFNNYWLASHNAADKNQ